MKNKVAKILGTKFAIMAILLSVFFVCCSGGDTLYAGNKKAKNHKKVQKIKTEKLKQQYENLKQDYHYTMENFVVLLQRLITVYDELDNRILELENKNQKYDQELFLVREVFNKKAQEDETFRVGFDLPFWDEPVYINGVRVERHPIGENPY